MGLRRDGSGHAGATVARSLVLFTGLEFLRVGVVVPGWERGRLEFVDLDGHAAGNLEEECGLVLLCALCLRCSGGVVTRSPSLMPSRKLRILSDASAGGGSSRSRTRRCEEDDWLLTCNCTLIHCRVEGY